LSELVTSADYARTRQTNITLPELLVAYLDAALP
jgi:hypothetical protein